MTDDELWLKHVEEYPQIKTWSTEKQEGARKGFKSGLAEGRKELDYRSVIYAIDHILLKYHRDMSLNLRIKLEKWKNNIRNGNGVENNTNVWHDLRKNPNDLPDYSKSVIVAYKNSLGSLFIDQGYLGVLNTWNVYSLSPYEVIAWCEIPKFEE